MHTKHLNFVTGCTQGGRKDALRICAHSGNSAQTDPKKVVFFLQGDIFWMVISYMAETPAGAKVILQSTQLIPASPRGAGGGDEGAHGGRGPEKQGAEVQPHGRPLFICRGIIIPLWSTIC